jgi:hypothetical protein
MGLVEKARRLLGTSAEPAPPCAVSAISAVSPAREAPAADRPGVSGWTLRLGRWYAPGYGGLTTPFDEDRTPR